MRTIYKRVLELTDRQTIEIERVSEPISVGIQQDKLCLWYKCTSGVDVEKRVVHIVGTGHPIENHWLFIGTVATDNKFVWHVFMERR